MKSRGKFSLRNASRLFMNTIKVTNRKLPRYSKTLKKNALFGTGEFVNSNPVSLQRTDWWLLSLHFGFRARDESRKLRWRHVQLQEDKDGGEMLVLLAERGKKIRHVQD